MPTQTSVNVSGVLGDGVAELQNDGSLEIELNYQNGDMMTLKGDQVVGYQAV